MARRRDRSFGGRHLAGEHGDLFLFGDGTQSYFTGDEVHPNRDIAAAAWERARVSTWRHEFRDMVWPPAGATAYDGLVCQVPLGGFTRARLTEALGALAEHRRDRPDLDALLEPEYDEYAVALELLLGLHDQHGTLEPPQLVMGEGGRLRLEGPDLRDTIADITTRPGHRGKAA